MIIYDPIFPRDRTYQVKVVGRESAVVPRRKGDCKSRTRALQAGATPVVAFNSSWKSYHKHHNNRSSSCLLYPSITTWRFDSSARADRLSTSSTSFRLCFPLVNVRLSVEGIARPWESREKTISRRVALVSIKFSEIFATNYVGCRNKEGFCVSVRVELSWITKD